MIFKMQRNTNIQTSHIANLKKKKILTSSHSADVGLNVPLMYAWLFVFSLARKFEHNEQQYMIFVLNITK